VALFHLPEAVEGGSLDRLPGWALGMLAKARVGHLGLIDDRDRPRVLPVTFALIGDAVYSAVDQKPKRGQPRDIARIRYLRRRSEAALTVDHYEDDWRRLAWVQVLGRVEILENDVPIAALDQLRAKYAPYRERPPPGPLLRLVAEHALCWRAERLSGA
jgi:PPOX class probable F420-dependent enzyme